MATPTSRQITVSQLTARLKQVLEGTFNDLHVVGEVAEVTVARSGHAYLTLKDEGARLSCMVFARDRPRLGYEPRAGERVVAWGRLSVYPPRGAYTLNVRGFRPLGRGDLRAAFEALKARLKAEGLFEPGRKRALPYLPRAVGVVTSGSGAARRDIEQILHRRAPQIPIVLYPARVQGEGAAEDIARGIAAVARHPWVEVVVVGRGGGSLEDLWAFNEEAVVRAIAACPVPVISAVGHETDVTLSDFVADRRAATPSAAAELVAPPRDDLRYTLALLAERLDRALDARGRQARARLDALEARLRAGVPTEGRRLEQTQLRGRLEAALQRRLSEARARHGALSARHLRHHPEARLARARARLARARARLSGPLDARLAAARGRLGRATDRLPAGPTRRVVAAPPPRRAQIGRLEALSPLAILARGYSIARGPDGTILTTTEEVQVGDALRLRLHAGRLEATVTAAHAEEEER